MGIEKGTGGAWVPLERFRGAVETLVRGKKDVMGFADWMKGEMPLMFQAKMRMLSVVLRDERCCAGFVVSVSGIEGDSFRRFEGGGLTSRSMLFGVRRELGRGLANWYLWRRANTEVSRRVSVDWPSMLIDARRATAR